MANWIREMMSKNLKHPGLGLGGFLVQRIFKGRNSKLEIKLAELTQIEPDHNVLEVGFGPGIGLKEAYKYIKDGKGKIYGIDISDVMLKEATGYLKEEIGIGKGTHSIGRCYESTI
ncbi:hypothetical protein KUTeg_001393 [Tegillarca granosa]|uniref:Methyltransferase domain-containing protein n=1 Tax=Tegillarca granosa TaxID=220873 RepID=A0ABQ9FRB9_TEGGR|nr:hypothetical protein KUTeg_001393 [Tegillarca granosa]